MANLVISYWGGHETGSVEVPIVYENKESLIEFLSNRENYFNHDISIGSYTFRYREMFGGPYNDGCFSAVVYTLEEWYWILAAGLKVNGIIIQTMFLRSDVVTI